MMAQDSVLELCKNAKLASRQLALVDAKSKNRAIAAMGRALAASRRKILVFLSAVLMIVVVMGTVMYVVEGPENGFTSIPVTIYWAITTMTTVGFGDITPKTDIGRLVASMMMLVGWGTLAVPTGIVTAEMTARRMRGSPARRRCPACAAGGHLPEAAFCLHCGAPLAGAPGARENAAP